MAKTELPSLFELRSDYERLYDFVMSGDYDEEAFKDSLDSLDGLLNDKAENCAFVRTRLMNNVEALKAEKQRIEKLMKSCNNAIDRINENLFATMKAADINRIDTQYHHMLIKRTAPSVVIECDIKDVPAEYINTTIAVNKQALKDDLKKGVELNGIAHLEQGETLVIS